MPSEKLSISFDARLAAEVRESASHEGESVSSWLADAATTKARQRTLREALDAFAEEHGALSDAEIEGLIRKARQTSRVSGQAAPKLAKKPAPKRARRAA
jgi:hypothetical protein